MLFYFVVGHTYNDSIKTSQNHVSRFDEQVYIIIYILFCT